MASKLDTDVFGGRRRTMAAPLKTFSSSQNIKREYKAAYQNMNLKQRILQRNRTSVVFTPEPQTSFESIQDSPTTIKTNENTPNKDDWEYVLKATDLKDNQWFSMESKAVLNQSPGKHAGTYNAETLNISFTDNAQLEKIQVAWRKQFLSPTLKQLDSMKKENDLLNENVEILTKELAQLKQSLATKDRETEVINTRQRNLEEDYTRISEDYSSQTKNVESLSEQVKDLQNDIYTKNRTITNNWKIRAEIWANAKGSQPSQSWKDFYKSISNNQEIPPIPLNKNSGYAKHMSKLSEASSDDSNNIWISQLDDYTELLESAVHSISIFKCNQKLISDLNAKINRIESSEASLLKDFEALKLEKKNMNELYLLEKDTHYQTRELLSTAQTKIEELELSSLDKCPECYNKSNPSDKNIGNATSLLGEFNKKRHEAEFKSHALEVQNSRLKIYLRKNLSNQEHLKQQTKNQKSIDTYEKYELRLKKIEDDLLQSEKDKFILYERIDELSSLLSNLTSTDVCNTSYHNTQYKQNTFKPSSNLSEKSHYVLETQIFALQMAIKQLNSLNLKSHEEIKTITLLRAKESALNRSLHNQISEQSQKIEQLNFYISELKSQVENNEISKQIDGIDYDLTQPHPPMQTTTQVGFTNDSDDFKASFDKKLCKSVIFTEKDQPFDDSSKEKHNNGYTNSAIKSTKSNKISESGHKNIILNSLIDIENQNKTDTNMFNTDNQPLTPTFGEFKKKFLENKIPVKRPRSRSSRLSQGLNGTSPQVTNPTSIPPMPSHLPKDTENLAKTSMKKAKPKNQKELEKPKARNERKNSHVSNRTAEVVDISEKVAQQETCQQQ